MATLALHFPQHTDAAVFAMELVRGGAKITTTDSDGQRITLEEACASSGRALARWGHKTAPLVRDENGPHRDVTGHLA